MRPPVRILAALAALCATAGAGYVLLRDSQLVAVEDVFVVGLRSDDQNAIRAALHRAALDMTTLNVREEALEAAVARFPTVAAVRARPDFPHRLTIEVRERLPVAVLTLRGRGRGGIPVGPAGTVLAGQRARGLPAVEVRTLPGGRQVEDASARAGIAVVAAAPEPLRGRIERVTLGRDGFRAELVRGPAVIIGAARDLAAKWAAAARVLADQEAAGASYVDVRVPERSVAGGLAVPTATPDPAATSSPEASATAPAGAAPTPTPTAPAPAATPVPVPTATP